MSGVLTYNIIGFVSFVSLFYFLTKHVSKKRAESDKLFCGLISKYEADLNGLLNTFKIEDIDIKYENNRYVDSRCSKDNDVSLLAPDVEKGYDIFRSKLKRGYEIENHMHEKSSMFMYILSGKLRVTVGKNVFVYESGGQIFINNGVTHSFIVLEDSDVITIALPPMLKRRK